MPPLATLAAPTKALNSREALEPRLRWVEGHNLPPLP